MIPARSTFVDEPHSGNPYRSPGYAAVTRPQPLTLAAIQHQVLDRDTLLLEYALGEDRSYVQEPALIAPST